MEIFQKAAAGVALTAALVLYGTYSLREAEGLLT